jgi:DNA-directed RNA polymerase subunit E'/Rpb7
MTLNIKEQILSITIEITQKELSKTKNIDGLLLYKLKRRLEKKCGECGYVLENSLSIIDRTHGKIRSVDNKSVLQYDINYKVKTIHPFKDERYECIVDSITKMGIISYLRLNEEDTIKETPLLVIIPKDYIPDDLFEKVQKKEVINVKILDSRMKHLCDNIQSVGTLID